MRERLDNLDRSLAALASSPPGPERAAAATTVFEEAHRLKGAAGTLRLSQVEAVAGRLANAYTGARAGARLVDLEEIAAARCALAEASRSVGDAALELPTEEAVATQERPATVLHVDDDPVTLKLVERVLGQRPGTTVLGAQDGEDALRLVRERRPDLVLLDLRLPRLSGAEILEQLRQDPSTATIPVLITSGGGEAGEVTRLLDQGATGYLQKPLDLRHVRAVVDEMLANG